MVEQSSLVFSQLHYFEVSIASYFLEATGLQLIHFVVYLQGRPQRCKHLLLSQLIVLIM